MAADKELTLWKGASAVVTRPAEVGKLLAVGVLLRCVDVRRMRPSGVAHAQRIRAYEHVLEGQRNIRYLLDVRA